MNCLFPDPVMDLKMLCKNTSELAATCADTENNRSGSDNIDIGTF